MTAGEQAPDSAAPVANDNKKSTAPPSTTLDLPLPPVTLDFAIRGEGRSESYLQRYVRKGDADDATEAVTGKGGFGTAYRFARDDSFTPPNSLLDATVNSADHDCSQLSDHHPQNGTHHRITDLKRSVSHKSLSRHSLTSYNGTKGLYSASVPPSPPRASIVVQGRQHAANRNMAPAVVVVKVCRTPTSGSYDELPKTGIGRSEAKIAAQELATGNPIGEHTRIVRGEARLLRYLQICCSLEGLKSSQSHIVRLLADTPLPKSCEQRWKADKGNNAADEDSDQYNGPPVPRLLVFERLVDLDAELTPKGWAKDKGVWSIDKVESISRDAVAGLRFLHYHAIVHGDLKPSNFMRDARTGVVKLIDLGASRRWVRLHNMAKERTTAVEELDKAMQYGQVLPQRSEDLLCEGLGSLTGSPHFMAPEVLLQAGRYLSADGFARNVLDDYVANPSRLPRHSSVAYLNIARRDFRRGWGIKADIWSWGCSVLSLLLRTIEAPERPSSNTVCTFDFSFESDVDALKPLWPLHQSNDSLPRFHQWARLYALRIMSVVEQGIVVPDYAFTLSTPFLKMVQAAFTHQDARPTAQSILDYIDTHSINNVEYMSEMDINVGERAPSRCHSTTPSCMSVSTVAMSLPDDPHNVDLSASSNAVAQNASANVDTRFHGSENRLAVPGADTPTSRSLPQMRSSGTSPREMTKHSTPRLLSVGLEAHIPQAVVQAHQATVIRSPSALHRRTASLAGEQPISGSRRSSIISDYRDPVVDGRASQSPNASLATAQTTPGAEERIRSKSVLAGEVDSQARARETQLPNPRSSHTTSNLREHYLTGENESAARRAPEQHSTSNKARRGSIFTRVASTLAPKLYSRASSTNMQGNYVGGEQLSRSGLRNGEDSQVQGWADSSFANAQTAHSHASPPQMEFLDGATRPSERKQRIGDMSTHYGDVCDTNVSPSQRKERNSAQNMLGLDFGRALQAPLRSVRSFTSLRSMNLTSNSNNEMQTMAVGQGIAIGANLHADCGQPSPSDIHIASASRGRYRSGGFGRLDANESHDYAQKGRTIHVSSAETVRSPFAPTEPLSFGDLSQGASRNGKAHAFLQFDPYASDQRSNVPTNRSQGPTRQRSWSSLLFRRGKGKT